MDLILWRRIRLESTDSGTITSMAGEQAGEEACIQLWGVSVVDGYLWRAQGLNKTADEIKYFILLLFYEERGEFGAQKLRRRLDIR